VTNEVESAEELVERILTLADVGFNVIVLGYGIDQTYNPGLHLKDAVFYWNELDSRYRSLIKDYTKSRGVYLLLGMGGPETQFEPLIRSGRGQTWGNTLMYDSLSKEYDGIFVDFYFNANDFCVSAIQEDSCLCQVGNPDCAEICEQCTFQKKCDETYGATWTTFMEQVLKTAVGIISSDNMIAYGVPADLFQYAPKTKDTKYNPGLGWKDTTFDRSSLYFQNTFDQQCYHQQYDCNNCDVKTSNLTLWDNGGVSCTKIASSSHDLNVPEHQGRDDLHYVDFVVARYFEAGSCQGNVNADSYNSKETIYIDETRTAVNQLNGYNGYQYRSYGSNIHSIATKPGKDVGVLLDQYDKSRIIPGYDLASDEKHRIFNFDKITNWSCEYQLADLEHSTLMYYPNLWQNNFAFFGDREGLVEKYKLFFNKSLSSCEMQLNESDFSYDFIESGSPAFQPFQILFTLLVLSAL